ncbi:MAG TPA: hypothetical protein VH540_21415 [Ktedonobacterales bacterium]
MTRCEQAICIGGPNCSHLLTTRLPEVALHFADVGSAVRVPELSESDGLALLERLAPDVVQAEPKRRAH